jgi:CheY-like chemotaxis protein
LRPKKNVLCVDDNEQVLSVRRFLLETSGYRVVGSMSAEEALMIFRQGGIDLVITDLVMPEMDGNELIRQVKKINPEVACILISGQVKAYSPGFYADALLLKGSKPAELLEQAKVLSRRKRGPKPRHTAVPVEMIEGAA